MNNTFISLSIRRFALPTGAVFLSLLVLTGCQDLQSAAAALGDSVERGVMSGVVGGLTGQDVDPDAPVSEMKQQLQDALHPGNASSDQ